MSSAREREWGGQLQSTLALFGPREAVVEFLAAFEDDRRVERQRLVEPKVKGARAVPHTVVINQPGELGQVAPTVRRGIHDAETRPSRGVRTCAKPARWAGCRPWRLR